MNTDANFKILRLKQVQEEVHFEILNTPSSPKRELLCDVNIHLLAAMNKLKDSENAPQQY